MYISVEEYYRYTILSGERELKEGEMEEDLDEAHRNNEVVLSTKLFPK
jgi:hypothetical protein